MNLCPKSLVTNATERDLTSGLITLNGGETSTNGAKRFILAFSSQLELQCDFILADLL